MDIRINRVESNEVPSMDMQSALEPSVLQEIVRQCVRAVKQELARDKRIKDEMSLLRADDAQDR